MSCFHPNKGFVVGRKDNGKKNIIYCASAVEFVYSNSLDFSQCAKVCEKLPESIRAKLVRFNEYLFVDRSNPACPYYYCLDSISMPCGQCVGCRIDRSKEWANRMMMEASYYEKNCFITLTYNRDYVPRSVYVDFDGVQHEAFTLRKRHFQKFMKDLRKRVSVYDPHTGKILDWSKVRFYACGEYGTQTLRPHYHAILFNFIPDDLKVFKRDGRGIVYYTSELISELWPFGFHLICGVTWDTCAYCARYVTKKLKKDDVDVYKVFNIEPEFSLMSRKPGIARRFYDENKENIYSDLDRTHIISFSTYDGGLNFKPPKYFDDLFAVEYPDVLEEYKKRQSTLAENIQALKLSKTDLDYYELLDVEKKVFVSRISSLKRL